MAFPTSLRGPALGLANTSTAADDGNASAQTQIHQSLPPTELGPTFSPSPRWGEGEKGYTNLTETEPR